MIYLALSLRAQVWDRLIGAQLDATTRPCNLVQLLPRLRESPHEPNRMP